MMSSCAQPLVIVLEDLHWGDLPTVKLIDAALRALPDRPWLVLALARPEVHALFPRLWAERAAAEGKGRAIPETVLAVVQGRLERLEVDARRVLRAASVYGQQFWRGGV